VRDLRSRRKANSPFAKENAMTFRARLAPLAAVLALAGAAAPVAALPTLAHADTAGDEAAVKAVLTQTVNDVQAGTLNYDSMTPDLAAAAKAQAAGMESVRAFGPVKSIERVGAGTGPYIYSVTYENGFTLVWEISVQADGKINYLNAHQ
jgi:hypothetical protein